VTDNGSLAAATWEQVELARHPDRPYALDYIHALFSNFFELHGDRLLMMEHSIYSVAMPEACASILWRDIARKVEAAQALKLTAADLKRMGLADEIVPEPPGGAQHDYGMAADAAGAALRRQLATLEAVAVDRLLENRYQRYRRIGAT